MEMHQPLYLRLKTDSSEDMIIRALMNGDILTEDEINAIGGSKSSAANLRWISRKVDNMAVHMKRYKDGHRSMSLKYMGEWQICSLYR